MNSKAVIKALNIVFIHWINPSLGIKKNAVIKLQRFCRKGSGAHAYHSMICNKADFGLIGPPVLYRQVCGCVEGQCERIPFRIYNKYQRMQYAIQKIYGGTKEINASASWSKKAKFAMNKYFTSREHCYCNNKPFASYEWMVSHPRGNFTSRDGLRYIMCELSGDELTYYTRFKLSNYLRHRLS